MTSKPIVNAFSEIVAATSAAVLPALQVHNSGITGVRFDYGHWLELQETLQQKDNSPKVAAKKSKYPVIFLLEDIPIDRTGLGYAGVANLTLLIATDTDKNYKSAERQAKKFDKILDLIYPELLNQIQISRYFIVQGLFPDHRVTDRKYMGRVSLAGNTANTMMDYIDAKEITNMRLTVNYETCLQAINIFETN